MAITKIFIMNSMQYFTLWLLLSCTVLPVTITNGVSIEHDGSAMSRSDGQQCAPPCYKKKASAEDDLLIRRLAPYAHMAYKDNRTIENWNCAHCGTLVPRPSKVYIFFNSGHGREEKVTIPIDERRKEIVVVFRGDFSSDLQRLLEIESFMVGKSAPLDWPELAGSNISISEILVAKASILLPVMQKALDFLLKRYTGYAVYFVGHSYGGPLAILFGLYATLSNSIPNTTAVAIHPSKFAGSDLMGKLAEHRVRTLTVIDNNDVMSRWPIHPDWIYLGELRKIEANVIYDCDDDRFGAFCGMLYAPANISLDHLLLHSASYVYDHLKFVDIPFYFSEKSYKYHIKELASILYNDTSFVEKASRAAGALGNIFFSLLGMA